MHLQDDAGDEAAFSDIIEMKQLLWTSPMRVCYILDKYNSREIVKKNIGIIYVSRRVEYNFTTQIS